MGDLSDQQMRPKEATSKHQGETPSALSKFMSGGISRDEYAENSVFDLWKQVFN